MSAPARRLPAAWALLCLVVWAMTIWAGPAWAADEPRAGAGPVWVIETSDTVNPATAEFLESGIAQANEADAALIVIRLDTPGGLVDSMRGMVKAIMGSNAPVVVFVAPAGARAASAGAFLLLAGHVAAMAPATNVGAASPVGGQGEDVKGTMGKKITADLSAMIKSLAKERGRDPKLAEEMVTEARSFDSTEAKKLGLIDLVAADLGGLLTALNGRVVNTAGGSRKIVTAGKTISFHTPGLREKILSVLASPNLAYILLMIGMMGLYFELSNPGAIFPGVLGGISLILAFFAMSALPISYAGLALLGLGVVMFIAEILVVSKGLLSLAGAVCLVLGSIMLFESDDQMMRVSLSVLVPTAAAVILFFGTVTYLAVRSQVKRATTGREGMVGRRGVAVGPDRVRVMGELWRAASDAPLTPGQAVEVVSMEGLSVRVRVLEGGPGRP